MEPAVRNATSADVEAIGRIHVRGWQHGYRGLLPDTFLAGLDAAERATGWRARLSEPGAGRVLVAELAGQVTGFVSFGPSRDEEEGESGAGEVYALYVDPDHWRSGAGTALMAAAVDELGRSGHPGGFGCSSATSVPWRSTRDAGSGATGARGRHVTPD